MDPVDLRGKKAFFPGLRQDISALTGLVHRCEIAARFDLAGIFMNVVFALCELNHTDGEV